MKINSQSVSQCALLAVLCTGTIPCLAVVTPSQRKAAEACEEIYNKYSGKSLTQVRNLMKEGKTSEVLDRTKKCNATADGKKGTLVLAEKDLEGEAPENKEKKIEEKQKKIEETVEDVKKEAEDQHVAEQDLRSFNFAVGLGTIYVSKSDVRGTTVDNGVLRITDSEKYKLGMWASTNTFFGEGGKYRWGAFVGAQIGGEDKIVNSFAVGLAVAASRRNVAANGVSGDGLARLVFQLGYGWTRVQRLADGYADGQTLADGTNQAVLRKTTVGGPVLLVSYTLPN